MSERKWLVAVLRKELIEVSPVLLLSIVPYVVLVVVQISDAVYIERFNMASHILMRDGAMTFLAVSTLLAGLLGLVQTLRESVEGTWGYYLFLPASRNELLIAKMLAGLTGHAAASLLALVLMLLAALFGPGSTETAFALNMLLQFFVASVIVYFGAFLSGIRPARLLGTRLFPLAGMVGVWALVVYATNWLILLPVVAVICWLTISTINQIAARRDFV